MGVMAATIIYQLLFKLVLYLHLPAGVVLPKNVASNSSFYNPVDHPLEDV